MRKIGVYALVVPWVLVSCAGSRQVVKPEAPGAGLVPHGKLFTALYQQQAAEYHAACFQSFALARLRLDEALRAGSAQQPAIVTDVDETLLNNSPYAVHRALQGMEYELESWKGWTAKGEADTLAGALSFLRYAADRGVQVFYITNREKDERAGTLANLQRHGFPFADEDHLISREGTSSKEARRQRVEENHDIVLLIGDNLADFSALFDKKPAQERLANTIQQASRFGSRFILIPNPNYGDWEGALFEYNYQLTPAQKEEIILRSLKGY